MSKVEKRRSTTESLIKSTADLREMLIQTIRDVRKGELSPPEARTIAALSTTILQSAKLDLDFLRFHTANEGMGKRTEEVVQLLPQEQGRLAKNGTVASK